MMALMADTFALIRMVRINSSRTPSPAGATIATTPARNGPMQAARYVTSEAPGSDNNAAASAYNAMPHKSQLAAAVHTSDHMVPVVSDSVPGMRFRNSA